MTLYEGSPDSPRRTPENPRRSNQGYKQGCRPPLMHPDVLFDDAVFSPWQYASEGPVGILSPSEVELQELQFLPLNLRSSSWKTGQESPPETWAISLSPDPAGVERFNLGLATVPCPFCKVNLPFSLFFLFFVTICQSPSLIGAWFLAT